jgi:Zn-finger nucleic acid-binding protein
MNRTLSCPNDHAPLRPVRRGAVTIDVCPECGGVWLDPGELERIKAAPAAGHAAPYFQGAPPAPTARRDRDEGRRDRDDDDDDDERRHARRRKRGLERLLDIFD